VSTPTTTRPLDQKATLGRRNDRECGADRYLGRGAVKLNPAFRRKAIGTPSGKSPLLLSQSSCRSIRKSTTCSKTACRCRFRNNRGESVKRRLRVFDFDEPDNNPFPDCARAVVRGVLYRRRRDLVGSVNGIPLPSWNSRTSIEISAPPYERKLPITRTPCHIFPPQRFHRIWAFEWMPPAGPRLPVHSHSHQVTDGTASWWKRCGTVSL